LSDPFEDRSDEVGPQEADLLATLYDVGGIFGKPYTVLHMSGVRIQHTIVTKPAVQNTCEHFRSRKCIWGHIQIFVILSIFPPVIVEWASLIFV
jgi:hypothetical protein